MVAAALGFTIRGMVFVTKRRHRKAPFSRSEARWPWERRRVRDGIGTTPVRSMDAHRASDVTVGNERRRQGTRKRETVLVLAEYSNKKRPRDTAHGGLPCTARERAADLRGVLPSTRPQETEGARTTARARQGELAMKHMTWAIVVVGLLVVGSALPAAAAGGGSRGGFHGGGSGSSGGAPRGSAWVGGGGFHGGGFQGGHRAGSTGARGSSLGEAWAGGGGRGGGDPAGGDAPYPYYPAPSVVVPQAPTEYIQQAPAPSQQAYWYYCQNAGAYYPYVKECPGGWMQVVPRQPHRAPRRRQSQGENFWGERRPSGGRRSRCWTVRAAPPNRSSTHNTPREPLVHSGLRLVVATALGFHIRGMALVARGRLRQVVCNPHAVPWPPAARWRFEELLRVG